MPGQDGRRRRPRSSQIPNRTSRPARSRPRRTRVSASRCPTSARPSPRSSGRTPRRCTHLFATTHSVAGRSGAQRRSLEAGQTPGHPVCGRPIEHDRDARRCDRHARRDGRPGGRRLPRSRLGRRRRRRLVVVHGAARRRGNERLELRARLAVAVRGHSCDAALASRHKGNLANRFSEQTMSPPRK